MVAYAGLCWCKVAAFSVLDEHFSSQDSGWMRRGKLGR